MSAMAMSTRCAKPTLNWRGYRPRNFSSGGRQTLSSSARRRGFQAAAGPLAWARHASVNCAPMVNTGVNEASGLRSHPGAGRRFRAARGGAVSRPRQDRWHGRATPQSTARRWSTPGSTRRADSDLIRGQADAFEQRAEARFLGRGRTAGMGAPRLSQLRADGQHRVQRGERTLRHEGDLAAAKGPPVPFRQIQQLAAVEAHVAGDRCFAEPVQAQDRQAQSALARAALPGEPQNLAGIYGDRRIVQDRPARTVRRRDPQLEQRLAVHLLASARRPDSKYRRSTFQMSGGPTTAGDTFRNSEETAHSVFR